MAKLIKVVDTVFEGSHPNGINKGDEFEGNVLQMPVIGKSCFVVNDKLKARITSSVVDIINETEGEITFKTLNSIYQLIL
jgi:hypothetical protein